MTLSYQSSNRWCRFYRDNSKTYMPVGQPCWTFAPLQSFYKLHSIGDTLGRFSCDFEFNIMGSIRLMIRWTIRYRTLTEFGSNTLFGNLPPHEFCLRRPSRFEVGPRWQCGGPATTDVVLEDGHFWEPLQCSVLRYIGIINL
jgi:hypothetical protein